MRITIFWLFLLIVLLLGNIILYKTSEEYRFFVTKIRHQERVIESQNILLSDSVLTQRERQALGRDSDIDMSSVDDFSMSTLEFLESISTRNSIDSERLELLPSQLTLRILDYFAEYNLSSVNPEEYLFSVTPEYPDPFLQWQSSDISFYSFPTKSFRDVYDIFDVLAFELPMYTNQVNNFWDKSFFINMESGWHDWYVRIVFEYQSEVFWLKIKNLHYNAIRDKLAERL